MPLIQNDNMADNKDQPPEGGTCREEEIQSMVIQTSGMCANDCFKVVYQCVPATDGDTSTDSEVTGSRDWRVA